MNEIGTAPPARMPAWAKAAVVLAFIGLVGGLLWSQLPKGGYPTDLSRIGSGRPVVVLAHDANYTAGMEVMEMLHPIRREHADRIDFLVAHLGMPDAQAFAREHEVGDGSVLLFRGDGQRLGVLRRPGSEGELRLAIAQAFGL
jgi:hypothetical protein